MAAYKSLTEGLATEHKLRDDYSNKCNTRVKSTSATLLIVTQPDYKCNVNVIIGLQKQYNTSGNYYVIRVRTY